MKQEISLVYIVRGISLLSLILFSCFASARAQTVIPRVCVETSYQTGTVTLASDEAAGSTMISVNGAVPPFVALVINPGGATEERVSYVNKNVTGSNPFTLRLNSGLHNALTSFSSGTYHLTYAHTTGEPIRFEGYSGAANFGYHNTTNALVTIPRGVSSNNYFAPGPLVYMQQSNQFQPGIHDNVFSIPFGGQTSDTLMWILNNGQAPARNGQGQGCGTITYQGKLSDGNAAANGQYDLRFTAFDALTGGTAQSGSIVVENTQITNGVFTVQVNFGSSLTNNLNAGFLEISVRAGTAMGSDPFTVLTPRQPITSVPFAVNAQKAFSVSGGVVQLSLTTNTPSSVDCNEAKKYRQTRVDAINSRLYICTATGWKSTVLQ
jgi:hypothetical protein